MVECGALELRGLRRVQTHRVVLAHVVAHVDRHVGAIEAGQSVVGEVTDDAGPRHQRNIGRALALALCLPLTLRLRLTLGAKLEHNSFTDLELQPTVRLLRTPDARHSAWVSVSRAVRTPSRGERDAVLHQAAQPGPGGLPLVVTIVGNDTLRSETLVANEAGYRFQPTDRVSLDVAASYNVHRRLRASEREAPYLDNTSLPRLILPVSIRNAARGEAYGLELAASWTVVPRWKLAGSYTGLDLQVRPSNLPEGRSPHHQFQARSYLDLTRTVQFDTAAYFVGELSSPRVPSYTRVDLRLGI